MEALKQSVKQQGGRKKTGKESKKKKTASRSYKSF